MSRTYRKAPRTRYKLFGASHETKGPYLVRVREKDHYSHAPPKDWRQRHHGGTGRT